MLDHDTVEESQACQKDTHRAFRSTGDSNQVKPKAMLADFAAQMLNEIVLDGPPHQIRFCIPAMSDLRLPLIFFQVSEPR